MKCLAIGMNPNYVLSEEERKKRFKKKNNPGELTAEIETQQGKSYFFKIHLHTHDFSMLS